jgi:hypothetical protein
VNEGEEGGRRAEMEGGAMEGRERERVRRRVDGSMV